MSNRSQSLNHDRLFREAFWGNSQSSTMITCSITHGDEMTIANFMTHHDTLGTLGTLGATLGAHVVTPL